MALIGDPAPSIKREDACGDTDASFLAYLDEFHDTPCTPEANETTPALTPSSEASEADLLAPLTPDTFQSSLLDTPTKVPDNASYFLETCVPFTIQLQDADEDRKDGEPKQKTLWDISLDPASTASRVFDYDPPLAPSKTEPLIRLSLSNSAINFNFSQANIRNPYRRCRENKNKDPKPTRTKPKSSPNRKTTSKWASKPLEQVLLRALPHDVLTRLTEDRGRCVAETATKPTHRCNNHSLQQASRATAAMKLLRSISATESRSFDIALDTVRQVLPEVCCTRGKHASIAMTAMREVEARLRQASGPEKAKIETEVKAWLQGLADGSMPEPETLTRHQTASNEDISPEVEKPAVSSNKPVAHPSARIAAAKSTPGPHDKTVGSTYQPFYKPGSRGALLSASQLIREKLHRSLLESERESGFLYVFWRRGDFGLIKIGYTSRSTDQRLKEWKTQCGDETEGCDTQDESSQILVRNVKRLEALVHAELKDYRKKQVLCPGCRKNHIEWFDVDIALARRVVAKWTEWLLAHERYEDRVEGKLLALGDAEIDKLCTPIQVERVPSLAVPLSGRRRSSAHARARSSITSQLMDNPWSTLQGRRHSWSVVST